MNESGRKWRSTLYLFPDVLSLWEKGSSFNVPADPASAASAERVLLTSPPGLGQDWAASRCLKGAKEPTVQHFRAWHRRNSLQYSTFHIASPKQLTVHHICTSHRRNSVQHSTFAHRIAETAYSAALFRIASLKQPTVQHFCVSHRRNSLQYKTFAHRIAETAYSTAFVRVAS